MPHLSADERPPLISRVALGSATSAARIGAFASRP